MTSKIKLTESLQKTIALEQRALADGGTLVNRNHTVNSIPYTLLKQDPLLVLTPSAIKESKIYSIIPNIPTGDFSYVQNTANGTRINEQGLIESVPANTPRITWVNGVPQILVEESRTNLVTESDDFTSADWTKNGGGTGSAPVVIPNDQDSIFDGQMADRVDFDCGAGVNTSDRSMLTINIPHITGNDYTGSIWIKAASPSEVGKEILMRPFGSGFTQFILTDQWEKISTTKTATVDNNVMEIGIRGTSSNSEVSLLLAGVQNEMASEASSTIQTTGATATRNDDIYSKTGISSLIGQNKGTIFFEGIFNNVGSSVRGHGVWLSPTVTNRGIAVGIRNNGTIVVTSRNGSSGNIQIASGYNYTLGEKVKIAATYDDEGQASGTIVTDGIKLYVNGILVGSVDFAVPDSGEELSEIHLARVWGGSTPVSSLYKNPTILKTALSDSEAIRLTTL